MTMDRMLQALRTRFSSGAGDSSPREALLRKYEAFKTLMAANNAALDVIADMQAKATGEFLFDTKYVADASFEAMKHGDAVIAALLDISDGGERRLSASMADVRKQVADILEEKSAVPDGPLVADMAELANLPIEAVGAKNRHLSEIRHGLDIPVPDGFSVTSTACLRFLEENGLLENIRAVIAPLTLTDKKALSDASGAIKAAILAAPWPGDIADGIREAFAALEKRVGRGGLLTSVRSSAVGEDGEFSFAGQFASILNVTGDELLSACKEVLASQFSPRAVVYFKARGMTGFALPMAIGIIAMVDSRASGVLYTRMPDAPSEDLLTIAGHWGLGPTTVDGSSTPDVFTVRWNDTPYVASTQVAVKEKMLLCREDRGLIQVEVPGWMRRQPCLTRVQAETLADFGMRLERFYGRPQDVEWALDERDELLVLQSRPLRVSAASEHGPDVVALRKDLPALARDGVVASRGVAAGPVFKVTDPDSLDRVPAGAVLVARSPSPELAQVIDRVAAVVAETGSIASHLATVAREFRVPAIFNVKDAVSRLPEGREVTVDADMGNVYDGRIETLLSAALRAEEPPPDTPIFRKLNAVLALVAPLNLTDPRSRRFKPAGCRTLHDILRYAHETAVREMFLSGSAFSKGVKGAYKLKSHIPVDFYFIDLGGGLALEDETVRTVQPRDFRCEPLVALWSGMAEVPWDTAAAAGGRGLASVMMTGLSAGNTARQMAEPNFVLVTDDYLNMNFRLGYHFSRVDAFLSDEPADNYASFLFHGGAADTAGRSRRIEFISEVLRERGWKVESRGDALFSRVERLPAQAMRDELNVLGRLIVTTRQMDTLLADDDAVSRAVLAFKSGLCDLGPGGGREE